MKILILTIMALAISTAFANEGQFSQKLDGTYELVKSSGDENHKKDCSNTVTIKVNEDNTLQIFQNRFQQEKISFLNNCDDKRYETCITSTEESYEISGEYNDGGTSMKGTYGSKIALGGLDKNKLTIKGYDYLNALRFVGFSRNISCTYKRQ